MHGLINKAIEAFAIETYGQTLWQDAASQAGLGFSEFEAMLIYDGAVTEKTVAALAAQLGKSRNDLLEDLGTFLVASPSLPEIRRLLRFGGVTYEDFLHSLDEFSDRVRLAVDDLSLPDLRLFEEGEQRFRLVCGPGMPGFGHVMAGVLRAMADDYGALAMLDHQGLDDGAEVLSVTIIQDAFTEGKRFELWDKSA